MKLTRVRASPQTLIILGFFFCFFIFVYTLVTLVNRSIFSFLIFVSEVMIGEVVLLLLLCMNAFADIVALIAIVLVHEM